MKKTFCVFAVMSLGCSIVSAEEKMIELPRESAKSEQSTSVKLGDSAIPETLVREGTASIGRAVDYLLSHQAEDGSFAKDPAITGLCIMAINQAGNAIDEKVRTEAVEKGRQFILKNVRDDGSIYTGGRRAYPTYSTAIALTALATLRNPADREIMIKARKFLIALQLDEDNPDLPTSPDNPNYGGVGYGPGKQGAGHIDLSNTQWVAEALYASEYLVNEDPQAKKEADLAWDKLAKFVTNMQHFPETNKQKWVVPDKNDPNYGGFVYVSETKEDIARRDPNTAKKIAPATNADKNKPSDTDGSDIARGQNVKVDLKTGQTETLRSYGSMTYAGLKSMIYAKVAKDDPRVQAALAWAAKNYTLDENPGMGTAGHYYYIQTFAKAHGAYGENILKTPDGKEHNWRIDLIKKLLTLQRGDGEWYNENNRYMEGMGVLSTAYSLLSMEFALADYLND